MSVFLEVSEIVQVVVFVPLKLLSLSLIVGIVSVYICIARCVGVRSARGRRGEREWKDHHEQVLTCYLDTLYTLDWVYMQIRIHSAVQGSLSLSGPTRCGFCSWRCTPVGMGVFGGFIALAQPTLTGGFIIRGTAQFIALGVAGTT